MIIGAHQNIPFLFVLFFSVQSNSHPIVNSSHISALALARALSLFLAARHKLDSPFHPPMTTNTTFLLLHPLPLSLSPNLKLRKSQTRAISSHLPRSQSTAHLEEHRQDCMIRQSILRRISLIASLCSIRENWIRLLLPRVIVGVAGVRRLRRCSVAVLGRRISVGRVKVRAVEEAHEEGVLLVVVNQEE